VDKNELIEIGKKVLDLVAHRDQGDFFPGKDSFRYSAQVEIAKTRGDMNTIYESHSFKIKNLKQNKL